MKVSVIGTGIYGIALSLDIVSNGHHIKCGQKIKI